MKLSSAAVLGLVALPAFPALASPASPGTIAVVAGTHVTERAGGSRWMPASHQRLHAGWDVRCPEGCVLAMPKGGTLRLQPGAEIRDHQAAFTRVGSTQAERAMNIELRAGSIRVDLAGSAQGMIVATRDGAEMFVATGGQGSAADRGAEASFAATHRDGHVRSSGGRWQPLAEGHAIEVHGASVQTEHTMPKAPQWQLAGLSAGPVGLAGPGGAARVGSVWNATEGAKGYEIEIARDAAFTDFVAVRTTSETMASEELAPGKYFARVAALDADGLAGPASTTRALRVVPVTVPAGGLADVEGRTLVVPPARALAIADADGVEFGLGKPRFQPASALDFTPSRKSERVWMRLRGDVMSVSSFTLEQRALTADVSISPRNAHWPADPIDVVVRISDPSHRIDPSTFTPTLKATIEIDALPLTWSHDGAVWKAHVAPRSILENTVLRIEATDEHDNLLGRGFAEIAPTRIETIAAR